MWWEPGTWWEVGRAGWEGGFKQGSDMIRSGFWKGCFGLCGKGRPEERMTGGILAVFNFQWGWELWEMTQEALVLPL